MPGAAFHITARTQGKEPWFEERLRGTIERHIVEGVTSSDAMLLAHAVMHNHFHIVLRQGMRPLGWIMQPIMRRVALLIQRAIGVEGHVFERRYRSVACENADHLRRAIVYTHLNPQRAGICDHESYAWTSAHAYTQSRAGNGLCDVAITFSLRLFATEPSTSVDQLRACYKDYLAWRIDKDKHELAGTVCMTCEPVMTAGDLHFQQSFCSIPEPNGRPTKDLRDKAEEILVKIDSAIDLNSLRRKRVGRRNSSTRRELIAGLLQSRYPGRSISNFFRVSDSAVSRIASQMRYAPLEK